MAPAEIAIRVVGNVLSRMNCRAPSVQHQVPELYAPTNV